MLDVALRRFLVYTAILLAVLAYVGWRVSGFSIVGARVVAGVAALAPIGFATYFVFRLDRSLRAYLKELVTQGRQRVAAIGAALCLVLLLIATAAPTAWLPWLLGSAAIGGFAVRLLTVSASNAHVRSVGLAVERDRLSVILWWVVVLCLIAAIGFEIAATQDRWWLSVVVVGLAVVIAVCLFIIVRRLRARRRAK
jgi:hypothetical protein